MHSPRWRKVLRDLWLNRTRTFLVVLAIAIGIFGFGSVLCSYSILMREINGNYRATNPASAVLWTAPLDDALVAAVRNRPAISAAEARRSVQGRIQVDADTWRTIWLFVINDFNDIRIRTLEPERGTWPPADREILIERTALSVAQTDVGATVVVKTPNGAKRELRVVGTVHDAGQAQAPMEGWVYGYITPGTLEWLGESRYLDELLIIVSDGAAPARASLEVEYIRRTVNLTKDWIEQNGRRVYRVEIPPPGKHPHADLMAGLLFLQASFGLLALLLSGVLVANMISALLAGQIRQIGMMKAVGARTRQVMSIYFGAVLLLGLAAAAVAIPASAGVGRAYVDFVAAILNIDIMSYEVPLWVFALQVLLGLLVPILVAAYPIYRGSRITVHHALNDYGIADFGLRIADWDSGTRTPVLRKIQSEISNLQSKIPNRPFLLSLRNTFRRRGRLALTLGTLAVGGAIFLTAVNVRASITNTVDNAFRSRRYDVEVRLNQPSPVERIEAATRDTPGVTRVECWGGANAALVYSDGTEGNRFRLIAPPVATGLIDFPVLEGRWLRPDDENALVVNHNLLDDEPGIRVGDDLVLRIGERETTWRVVGVVREVLAMPLAYASYDYFARLTGQAGYANDVRAVTAGHDPAAQQSVKQSLERDFAAAGLDVLSSASLEDRRIIVRDHLEMIANFLVLMSALIVAVGGLGLMTTMSINVIERTREIGVMRAIGASNYVVLRIITAEGVLIGLLSWLIAIVLAPPASMIIGNTMAMMFIQTTLDMVFALPGLVVWLVIVVIFAAAASFYPAWRAARLTVREVLAYE